MKEINVFIEISGIKRLAGVIKYNDSDDAFFSYDEEYIKKYKAISISLPINKKVFSNIETKNFFDGLLPEGYVRNAIAESMHIDTNDYISLLILLGKECIGALQILEKGYEENKFGYKKITKKEIKELAKVNSDKSIDIIKNTHLSLAGASKKIGLYYDEKNSEWYLPLGIAPSTHIIKQSHVRLNDIVINEMFCMLTAKYIGLDVAESFIINTGDYTDDSILYVTKRFDRYIENGKVYRLHQEDFAQCLSIASNNKYENTNENYLEKCVEIINNYSSNALEDNKKLLKILLFDYMIGNTDNHIKNLSIIYDKNMQNIKLSPVYDIVATSLYESTSKDFAMNIGGKRNIDDISFDDFKKLPFGKKLINECIDYMRLGFKKAMEKAYDAMMKGGYERTEKIYKKILKNGRF